MASLSRQDAQQLMTNADQCHSTLSITLPYQRYDNAAIAATDVLMTECTMAHDPVEKDALLAVTPADSSFECNHETGSEQQLPPQESFLITSADTHSNTDVTMVHMSSTPATSGERCPTGSSALHMSSSIPTAAVDSSHSSYERRGSGFLLLAAEAMERSELRKNAMRQAELELAVADTNSAHQDHALWQQQGILSRESINAAASAVGNSSNIDHGETATSFVQGFRMSDLSGDQHYNSNYSRILSTTEDMYPMDENFKTQVYMAAAKLYEPVRPQSPVLSSLTKSLPTNHVPDPAPSADYLTSSSSPPENLTDLTTNKPTDQPSALPYVKQKSKSTTTSPMLPSGRPRPPLQRHVYHDYASIPETSILATSTATSHPNHLPSSSSNYSNTSSSPPLFVRKKTGGVSQPFPEKLMDMLDRESLLHPDVVSWLPHGRAFLVKKPKVFTNDIMPGYFRQSKLTSFQRQLNLYGFRRITQGTDAGAYYHELFLRSRPNLCTRMMRQKVKGTGHKQPTDIESEPDFYSMSSVFPLNNAVAPSTMRTFIPQAMLSFTSSSEPIPDTTACPLNNQQLQPLLSKDSLDNQLLNSPRLYAAALLKRLSSLGTTPKLNLDENTDKLFPPLVPIAGMTESSLPEKGFRFYPTLSGGATPSSFDSLPPVSTSTYTSTTSNVRPCAGISAEFCTNSNDHADDSREINQERNAVNSNESNDDNSCRDFITEV